MAAPKCLQCPEPKCLEDMTFGERVKWGVENRARLRVAP